MADERGHYNPELEQLVYLVERASQELHENGREILMAISDVLKAIITDEGHNEVIYKLLVLQRQLIYSLED